MQQPYMTLHVLGLKGEERTRVLAQIANRQKGAALFVGSGTDNNMKKKFGAGSKPLTR